MRAILYTSKFDGDKSERLTETHTLETRDARICLDALLFFDNGEKPNEQTIIRKIQDTHHPFRTITCIPRCFGAEMLLISGPQLVFSENKKILSEYGNNYDKNILKVVFCRDKRKYWHLWME